MKSRNSEGRPLVRPGEATSASEQHGGFYTIGTAPCGSAQPLSSARRPRSYSRREVLGLRVGGPAAARKRGGARPERLVRPAVAGGRVSGRVRRAEARRQHVQEQREQVAR